MFSDSIRAGSPGQLVPTSVLEQRNQHGSWESARVEGHAFVPDPLPPAAYRALVADLVPDLVKAVENLARLDGVARGLANPHLLLYPLMLREAKLSSRIENTIASAEEVVLVEAGEEQRSDAVEVRNYIRAMRHGVSSELPICNRLLCEMHRELLAETGSDHKQPGRFRSVQAYIGDGSGLARARYVPPPPGEPLIECMRHFERFLNDAPGDLPGVVAIALGHYQFEAIHPFADGNGRIGRGLAALSLCKGPAAITRKPFVYISGFFERNRQEYYDRLLRVTTHGDWSGWARFFVHAVTEESAGTLRRIQSVLALRERFVASVMGPRSSALLVKLIDEFFRRPAMRTRDAAQVLNVLPQAAQRYIDRLAEQGVIEEVTGGRYDRIWVVRRLLRVIEEDTPSEAAEEPRQPASG